MCHGQLGQLLTSMVMARRKVRKSWLSSASSCSWLFRAAAKGCFDILTEVHMMLSCRALLPTSPALSLSLSLSLSLNMLRLEACAVFRLDTQLVSGMFERSRRATQRSA